jgi:hypothetical protein
MWPETSVPGGCEHSPWRLRSETGPGAPVPTRRLETRHFTPYVGRACGSGGPRRLRRGRRGGHAGTRVGSIPRTSGVFTVSERRGGGSAIVLVTRWSHGASPAGFSRDLRQIVWRVGDVLPLPTP